MRFLTTKTLELVEFAPDRIPNEYAILSHTWGDNEVLYEDIINKTVTNKSSFAKVQAAANQAHLDRFDYIWIDNCCINKSSSAELSESINSMYAWYKNAAKCYAYLSDVPAGVDVKQAESKFASSRWFTRGFTLQELLAPANVVFFDQDWNEIGKKKELYGILTGITGVGVEYLRRDECLSSASIAQRMSWAANRQTSRPEDVAYCLLGIFNISMPLLYGEGDRAFIRLQEEIMRQSDDQSIFAWREDSSSGNLSGLLATSPAQFSRSRDVLPYENWEVRRPYFMTNRGLQIDLHLTMTGERDIYIAALNCPMPPGYPDNSFLGIFLRKLTSGDQQYARVQAHRFIDIQGERGTLQTIFVRESTASVTGMHRGLFPYHAVKLRGGPNPENKYRVVNIILATITPPKASKPWHALFGDRGQTPEAIRSADEETRKWIPAAYRRPFPIDKGSSKLAAVITFESRADGEQLHIMLGSMGTREIGFDAIDIPNHTVRDKIPAEAALDIFQGFFQPKGAGKVLQLNRHRAMARVETKIHDGIKYYMVDLRVNNAPIPDEIPLLRSQTISIAAAQQHPLSRLRFASTLLAKRPFELDSLEEPAVTCIDPICDNPTAYGDSHIPAVSAEDYDFHDYVSGHVDQFGESGRRASILHDVNTARSHELCSALREKKVAVAFFKPKKIRQWTYK